jgi:hypothetical protein
LENSSPKKNQAIVPERGRLARKRGDALKNVAPEIKIGFTRNVLDCSAILRASRPRSGTGR